MMIERKQIEAMKPGDVLQEAFITVRRDEDTLTGKPNYHLSVNRVRPLLQGSQGAHTVNGVMKTLATYRHWLKL